MNATTSSEKFSTKSIYKQCKLFTQGITPAFEKLTIAAFKDLLALNGEGEKTYEDFLLDSTKFDYTDLFNISRNYSKAWGISRDNNCRILKIFCNWKSDVALKAYKTAYPQWKEVQVPWIHPHSFIGIGHIPIEDNWRKLYCPLHN